jgi:hypothetical protein
MARLDTIRQYFIEQFVSAIGKGVAAHPSMRNPAELFTGGIFNATPDPTGFKRIPSLQNLASRIAAASDPTVKSDLKEFLAIVESATGLLTFGLGPVTVSDLTKLARQYAPQIRQNDGVTFWPMSMDDYLNYDDGTLKGYLYDSSGRTPLQGQIFNVMFQNPALISNTFAQAPYEQRVPFVATVGIDPSVPPYPISPLDVGQLNLSAADSRLYPGVVTPTLYAEVKNMREAPIIDGNYQTAALAGRFTELRNNRLQNDPAPMKNGSNAQLTGEVVNAAVTESAPFLLVYHAFYPVDDEARKTKSLEATNREGHHLATAILLEWSPTRKTATPAYLFFCAGPDDVRIVPFNHPIVQLLDPAKGDGKHVILYAGWGTPLKLALDNFFSSTAVSISGQNVSTADTIIGGLLIAAAIAAAAGGPVGWVVAAVLVVLCLLLILACLFFISCGQPESSNPPPDQYQPKDPSDNPSFQNVTTYLAPPGTGAPGRAFELRLIPHAIDQNLYGLQSSTTSSFVIEDNPSTQQTLGWAAFPGGLGYQVEREMPGATDRSGSQWRNYFTLFTDKYAEMAHAQTLVTYFGK